MVIKILVGIPTSGKSTYTQNFLKENKNWISISRDSIKLSLFNEFRNDYRTELLINKISNSIIQSALETNHNIIIDNTNLKQKDIKNIIKEFNHLSDIEFELFPIDLEEAIRRNEKRENKVPIDTIKECKRIYDILITQFDFKKINRIDKQS